jgi:hypothetical protein
MRGILSPATVLISKLKFFIFEEVVHEHDEFAHTRGEGDQWFFASGPQACIKLFKNAIVPDGAQSGHVKGTSHGSPATADVAYSSKLSAVAVIGSHSRQGGSGLRVKFSQFGQFGQHRGGHDRPYASDGLQTAGFLCQAGLFGNQGGDGLITLVDLFFEGFLELAGLADTEGIGVMLGAIVFGGTGVDELAAALGHIGQPLLVGRNCWRGRGLERGAITGEDGAINRVGFGALALGAGEIADPARFDNAHRDVRSLQSTHDRLFVAAGGFADDVGAWLGSEEFEDLGVTFRVIGQGVETTGQMELQRKLGNIEADMEDGSVVLTHTCKDTSPGDWRSPCSSNGSSLGQWARAKHAGERITPERMQGESVSARAAVLRPAGRRTAPAWLAFASPPSRTIKKIQGGRG